MKITKSDFGTLNTGENIYIYHMENANGAYVEVIDFGSSRKDRGSGATEK